MTKWRHPTLGSMVFETYAWETRFDSPEFAKFTFFEYDFDREEYSPLIYFRAEDESDFPSPEVAEVGKIIAENHRVLINSALKLLFRDFRGETGSSGMWWHGALDRVHESLLEIPENLGPLECSEDLYSHLGSPSIIVQPDAYRYDQPCGILRFEASFEREHGVGFLTDGERILGIGDQEDICPFDKTPQNH